MKLGLCNVGAAKRAPAVNPPERLPDCLRREKGPTHPRHNESSTTALSRAAPAFRPVHRDLCWAKTPDTFQRQRQRLLPVLLIT